MRGRVMSLVMLGGVGLAPFSLAIAGVIIDFGAVTLLFSVAGAIVVPRSLAGFYSGVPAQMSRPTVARMKPGYDGPAIEAVGLVKEFERGRRTIWQRIRRQADQRERFRAVDGIDLRVERGEIFGVLGPNGAGKTTTMKMLSTLLEPTEGTARILGYDVVREAREVRRRMGAVLSDGRSLYWKLTARENLEYFAALYHVPPNGAEGADRIGPAGGQAGRPGRRLRRALQHRHAAAPGAGPRPAARSGAAAPGRADGGSRPAVGARPARPRPRPAGAGPHRPPHHPLHGGGRPALRPDRDRRPRPASWRSTRPPA